MSRELKFRVYSFVDKAFHYFDIYEGYPQGIAGGVSEPQQYTGLFDSKGKEIYEGDIIKEHHYEDWGDKVGYEYIGVITHKVYNSNDAGNQFSGFVTFPDTDEHPNYNGCPIKKNCEIIGNIIENKELLQ